MLKALEEEIDKEALLCCNDSLLTTVIPKVGPRAKFVHKLHQLRILEKQNDQDDNVVTQAVTEDTMNADIAMDQEQRITVDDEPDQATGGKEGPAMTRVTEYDIRELLSKHPQGKEILKEYDEEKSLAKDNRRKLVRIMVSAMMEKHGTHPTSTEKERLANSIITSLPRLHTGLGVGYQHFYTPGMKSVGASGFIQTRVENIQRHISRGCPAKSRCAAKSIVLPVGTLTKGSPSRVTIPPPVITDTEGMEMRRNWLRHNRDPQLMVRQYMAETRPSRLAWINSDEAPAIQDILATYPRMGDPDGFIWIEEDFQHLFPKEHSRFTASWERLSFKLLSLVQREGKEDVAKKLLYDLAEQGEPNRRQATANTVLYLLPNVLPPTVIGKSTRNVKRWKPSICESRSAFIQLVKTGTSLVSYRNKKREECRTRGITWQPQILVLGENVATPDQVMVLVNDTVYEVGSLIKAVDVCFKAFFVLNADYPPHAHLPWLLLQRAVFGIATDYDVKSARVDEVLGFLKI